MHSQTLSALMTNYNHGHLIGRAIEAVVSQSRLPDEYLILDDASTDNSLEIIESYASQYPFIRVLRNKQNLGVLESFRRLLEEASGDYIYGGAADDYVLPGFFESVMKMVRDYPHAGVIFGKVMTCDNQGNRLGVSGVDAWTDPIYADPQRFLEEYMDVQAASHSLCSASVLKSSAISEMGGWQRELEAWADTFIMRAIALRHGACYIPEPCTVWTMDPTAYSGEARTNPRISLDFVTRAAGLMRSGKFKELFPETSVRHWERRYRDSIIHRYEKDLYRSIDRLAGTYGKSLPESSNWQRVFRRCLKGLLKIPIWQAKRRLQRYQGDLSC